MILDCSKLFQKLEDYQMMNYYVIKKYENMPAEGGLLFALIIINTYEIIKTTVFFILIFKKQRLTIFLLYNIAKRYPRVTEQNVILILVRKL